MILPIIPYYTEILFFNYQSTAVRPYITHEIVFLWSKHEGTAARPYKTHEIVCIITIVGSGNYLVHDGMILIYGISVYRIIKTGRYDTIRTQLGLNSVYDCIDQKYQTVTGF